MVYLSRYCDSSLSTASNWTRHEHHFHPDELVLPTYQCSIGEFTSQKISNLELHMRTEHTRSFNCCRSCHLGFNDSHLYAQHMNSVHSLPVFDEAFEHRDMPTESAFNGLLRTFGTTDADEARDLENFMRVQKPRINSLINEQLCHGPQKVQLCAKLQLIKYHSDQPDNAEGERIDIYANSLMTSVYANGLTSVLTTFALMGSGWVLEKVLKVDRKFALFRPVWGSSNIALPKKIANCRGLLNIGNHDNQQCFRYCYVAAYHLHQRISLDRVNQNYQTTKTFPNTYNQLGIHQPLGEFDMLMGFEIILEFEKLNDVQVNVFGYDNGHFFSLKSLSYEFEFVLDLLLLYDGDHHHYVLITDLVLLCTTYWLSLLLSNLSELLLDMWRRPRKIQCAHD